MMISSNRKSSRNTTTTFTLFIQQMIIPLLVLLVLSCCCHQGPYVYPSFAFAFTTTTTTTRPYLSRSSSSRGGYQTASSSSSSSSSSLVLNYVKQEQISDECPLDDDSDGENPTKECLSMIGYKSSTSSFLTVSEVFIAQIESLRGRFPSFEEEGTTSQGSNMIRLYKRQPSGDHIVTRSSSSSSSNSSSSSSHVANLEYNELISEEEVVLVDTVRKSGMVSISRAFPRAGPRRFLHFNPRSVNAAIVTCGGLCPGLNNVIRELVHSLYYLYDVNSVYGITGGFHGFYKTEQYPPVLLTNDLVENIHHDGGTVLRSSRGGFDIDEIITFLQEKNISQLYIIGGDGTHRGAHAIHEACVERNLNIAIAGIPKTIDNDCDYIDRSFGFQSAVEAAQAGIRTAKTEAMCNVPNGIGMIKLMGRSAGYLAAFAALGSGDVDLVLIPEVPIVLDGPQGILPFLRRRIKEQKYAVVVVAEGAGEELLGISETVDAGGNRERPQIGSYLQKVTEEYFATFHEECTIKYIDPSYTVRSVPANAADSLYCQQLAMDAVHGCMAGLTGFSVGVINRAPVYIPIPQLVATSPRNMDPHGTTWERILAMTGQPNTAEPKPDRKNKKKISSKTKEDEIVSSSTDATSSNNRTESNDEESVMEQLISGIPEPTAH